MISIQDCKTIIKKIARSLDIDPALITTRLLDAQDKKDLQDGKIPIESLITHVKVWKENGMPDYTNGTGALYTAKKFTNPIV